MSAGPRRCWSTCATSCPERRSIWHLHLTQKHRSKFSQSAEFFPSGAGPFSDPLGAPSAALHGRTCRSSRKSSTTPRPSSRWMVTTPSFTRTRRPPRSTSTPRSRRSRRERRSTGGRLSWRAPTGTGPRWTKTATCSPCSASSPCTTTPTSTPTGATSDTARSRRVDRRGRAPRTRTTQTRGVGTPSTARSSSTPWTW